MNSMENPREILNRNPDITREKKDKLQESFFRGEMDIITSSLKWFEANNDNQVEKTKIGIIQKLIEAASCNIKHTPILRSNKERARDLLSVLSPVQMETILDALREDNNNENQAKRTRIKNILGLGKSLPSVSEDKKSG